MLKITDNVFGMLENHLVHRLEESLGGESVSGIILPDITDVSFSDARTTASYAEECILRISQREEIALLVLQESWQQDTPRMRYIGLKPSLAGNLYSSILKQTLLTAEGRVRFAALLGVTHANLADAIQYLIRHQETALLLIQPKFDDELMLRILSSLPEMGLNDVLSNRPYGYPDWRKLADFSRQQRCVITAAGGWNEEDCDLRLVMFGDREDIERISLEST